MRAEAARLGVQLTPVDAGAKPASGWWRQPKMLALASSGILLLAGLGMEKLLGFEAAGDALYLATILTGGFYPARSALTALRARRLTISTLLIAAAAGALALGILEEAAMLVVVFSLGEALEEYVSDRARGSIRQLMALAPAQARRRLPEGAIKVVAAEELHPGDIILVRPGERLATDGVVETGSSAVDQSSVTGESMPVEVVRGSRVFGGTLNGNGALEIRVSKEHADTVLARVIHQVEQAQASKGSAQRFADRFGAVYTPAMFALAILLSVLPPLFGADFREWFYRALVVLTVSCSCGLVISVPVAVVAAISRAARDGILIKGGAYLEALGSVRTVAFDKTGTLTRGRPRLTDVIPARGNDAGEILRLAASIEAASAHPISGAVLEAARSRGITWDTGRDLRSIAGSGIEATVDGRRLFVGKAQINGEVKDEVAKLEAEGKTVMVLAQASEPLGVLAVSDEPRAEAREVVRALGALGIRRSVMLTGDNEATAAAVARSLGIDDWRAGLLPEDKTSAVNKLREAEGAIAMIGDGINDAPALATADVGIAMGAAGSDVALETADVALMADDLRKLPQAILLSRRALTNIHQNIALSLAAVAILVTFALLGRLSLTSGLLLNEGSALLIIANGLRLLRAHQAYRGASLRPEIALCAADCADPSCRTIPDAIAKRSVNQMPLFKRGNG
ncbi:MAG TPA: cation-translocating P-type ATPase [Xanthobacteraceae bacterium]|nr:cation-translocating P-type ATPase [Xanthobacteraceae bacterium]